MELRQVRYFVAVLDSGSFTDAAARLHIVQSAVSQQISRLERDLGITLFDRSRRTVELTSEGLKFEPFARALLEAEFDAYRAISPDERLGPIRIGVPTGLGPVVAAAARMLPEQVEIISAASADREGDVARGDTHAAVVRMSPRRSDVVAYPIRADELVVTVPTGHPAENSEPVSWRTLAAYPLVFSVDAVGKPVCTRVLEECRRNRFEPRLHILSPGVDGLSGLSTVDDSWTVFYAAHAAQLNERALSVRFLQVETPVLLPAWVVVRRRDSRLGARLAAAVEDASTNHQRTE